MNTDESELALFRAERRVREIQTKLHRWARDDPHRRFDDLFNLVADPAFLLVAWDRVRGNKGARTAGVDGQTVSYVQTVRGVEGFLDELRAQLRDRSFRPLPVRERMIPKAGGKRRRLGIAAVRDRVVQASLKLVLEPIFEADFLPCSYGFRPNRRTHDAVAEIRHLTSHSYEWIVEGDIKACFDEISHPGLMDRVRERVGDKRVLALVKAFLKAGILGEDRVLRATDTGTPQGSILSPLLSNVALSVLDEHIAQAPGGPAVSRYQRAKRRAQGLPNYRLVRYADDWCLVISGTQGRRGSPAGGDSGGLVHDGPAPVAGEDRDHPHRRGPRFSGLAHPASPQTRHRPVLRLHLPGTQGPAGRDGQGQDVVPADGHEPAAGRPAASAEPDAAGLVRPLPARRVQRHLRLPERLHLGPGHRMVAPQTPPDHLEGTPPPLLRGRMVAGHKRTGAVQPGEGAHHALPIPGRSHPGCVAGPQDEDHTSTNGACGAPVARKRARRVREAARGNPPVETPAGRPGPTSRACGYRRPPPVMARAPSSCGGRVRGCRTVGVAG